MKSKIQNLPLKQRMMIKRIILLSTAVLFVGITAFAAFAQANKNVCKPGDEKQINHTLYFNTRVLCEGKKMQEGC
jgi:hypothetical protein